MSSSAISGLRKAVPYLQLFRGQTFVIKVGGEALQSRESTKSILEQVGVLQQLGIRAVFVHGGGPQATELAEKLGAKSEFVDGRRVTSPEMLHATVLALNGEAQASLLSVCREMNLPAVGVSGIDAGLLLAKKRPPVKSKSGDTVDYGSVGDIIDVNPSVINDLLSASYLPMVSPISATKEGDLLNINADTVASSLAVALGATKLILMTGAPGVLRDPADPMSVISQLSIQELEALEKNGTLGGGMLPKATSIGKALAGGVARVHVIGFAVEDSLLLEIFTNEGSGTLIEASC